MVFIMKVTMTIIIVVMIFEFYTCYLTLLMAKASVL